MRNQSDAVSLLLENAITRHYYGASNVPFTMIGPEAGKLDGMSVNTDTLESVENLVMHCILNR